jgi:spore germination protein YaaH
MTSQRNRRTIVAGLSLAAVLVTAGCASSSNPNTAVVPSSLFVEGYGVAAPSTLTALARDKSAIDMVGISGVSITPQGEGVAASSQEALDIAKKAKADGAKSELLINNVDTAKGDFSPTIATKMLSSEENRQFVIAGLAAEVDHGGYNGIQLDLESLSAQNSDDLVSFVSELRATLPPKATISMTLMASTTPAGYAESGYDIARLSKDVSRFVLMAYDEHGTGFSAAGPVGGLPWASQAIGALTSLVSPSKVDLGVAGYGYSWKSGGGGGVVTPAQARKQAGSRARWVAAQGEWTAKLANGTILWWSDAKSLTVRSNLAVSDKLHGVALWQMSTGDDITRSK